MLDFKITSWCGPRAGLYGINVTRDKMRNTTKANYYKVSLSNFYSQKHNATGVLIEYD